MAHSNLTWTQGSFNPKPSRSPNNPVAFNVYSKFEIDVGLNLKSDKDNTYSETEVDIFLSTLQAAIDRRVLVNTVDINGKFKLNATTNDILNIQQVDGALLYDALEVSFNMTDKSSIFKVNNVDRLSTLNLKASASNVYAKEEITNNDFIYANALNTKADKTSS